VRARSEATSKGDGGVGRDERRELKEGCSIVRYFSLLPNAPPPLPLPPSQETQKAANLDCTISDIAWFPTAGKTVVDMFAAACTDGTLRFFKKSGQLEKKIDAHEGACIVVEWNVDGSSMVTGGEDGEVKVWSRNGNLR